MPSKLRSTFRNWRRWFRHLFVTVHFLVLSALLIASATLYIAFRTDSLDIVNTYLLKPLGIHYSFAEGSLMDGFTLHDLRSDSMRAKTLSVQYNLAKILKGEHVVDTIRIDGLRIHLEDFAGGDSSPWPLPTVRLRQVHLTNLQLISNYPVELDIDAENGHYDGKAISFNALQATFRSRYADGAIKGQVVDNAISGNALLYPNAKTLAPYSGRYADLPRAVALKVVELSDQQVSLQGTVERLTLKQEPSLIATAIALDFTYRYENDFLDVNAAYLLQHNEDSMQTKQHLRYAFAGETTSEFSGTLSSPKALPSNLLTGSFQDDKEGFKADATLDGSTLRISTHDYDRFAWEFRSDHQNLSFLPMLPESLKTSPLVADGKGEYRLNDNTLSGTIEAKHNYLGFTGAFQTCDGKHTLDGNLTLPQDAPMWKEWPKKPPSKLTLSLDHDENRTHLQLWGDSMALSAALKGETISGSGNYLGIFFDFAGNTRADETTLDITSTIPSAFTTASKLHPITLYKGEYYDAEIRAKTHITLTDKLDVKTDLSIPWYAVVLDSQRAFGGTDGRASLHYRDGNLTVENYRFEITNHPVESDRSSLLSWTSDGLVVRHFWIYDTLLLTGTVSKDLQTALHLSSGRFSYHGPEGFAHASADITFTRDAEANHNLYGELSILDGSITYLPLQQFKVMDDDIIIVQDVRPPSHTKLSMNLHVTAKKPLTYQTKELDLSFTPDITLWKDPTGPMEILGMLSIPSGTATTAGKRFDIQPSEIYFGGDIPINPYLNLTIRHEVDYNKIFIYVTHTLDSPIFLFSSDPVMSQNDIMSYILFGTPASTSLGAKSGDETGTSTIRADATNFMLGAGLKGLINSTTKLQIDTMNILTTQQGGIGFEVGARLNKNLRVLYKNDVLSSVLIQYQFNRWLRLDADVHELGQGINAVYIKDFRDFLPHNVPAKK